jgi:alpha-L-fucosidase
MNIKRTITHIITASALAISLCNAAAHAQQTTPSNYVQIFPGDSEADIIRKAANVTPSPRQLRWQKLELTAFLHFGMNTFTDREWGDGKEDTKLFNPSSLDARQWVRVLKEAGFKQVIGIAKHHDGFCMWPTRYTEHSVKNSPWKNGKGDLIKDLSDACHEYNIGFGVYLSPWDRNNPDYGDSPKYNDYFVNQLTELLSNYGRVDEVWFDGANGEGPNGKKQVYDFDRWYTLIRKLQPTACIAVMGPDVRWVGTESGYGRTTEWSAVPVATQAQESIASSSQKEVSFVPKDMTGEDLGSRSKIESAKSLVWYPAEIDVSIRPGWFYHTAEDAKVKTPEKLLDIYYSSVGRNGVLLLNIPPNKRGLISDYDIKNLQEWKRIIDGTFIYNVLKKSVEASNKTIKALLDGNDATYWTTQKKDTSGTISFKFTTPQSFDVIALQENIRIGQRIEKFILEYKDGASWKTATEGTTVGYKRLIKFPAVTTDEVRLRIESSRLNPTIAEFGLYTQAK